MGENVCVGNIQPSSSRVILRRGKCTVFPKNVYYHYRSIKTMIISRKIIFSYLMLLMLLYTDIITSTETERFADNYCKM